VEKLYLLAVVVQAVVQLEQKAEEGMVNKRYLNEINLFKTITLTIS
jgi:hypothetical protein